MAGITIAKLETRLSCSKIVRSMPNIPTQIGMGMNQFGGDMSGMGMPFYPGMYQGMGNPQQQSPNRNQLNN